LSAGPRADLLELGHELFVGCVAEVARRDELGQEGVEAISQLDILSSFEIDPNDRRRPGGPRGSIIQGKPRVAVPG
jgi:hypothetical protein